MSNETKPDASKISSQGPSASAYVTYYKSEDALRAIQAVNNIFVDGRTLKASLGTTKYCSHFMKNQPCPKQDCMYLHELGEIHLENYHYSVYFVQPILYTIKWLGFLKV